MNKLEELGRAIAQIRDTTSEDYLQIKAGALKSEEALQLHKLIASLGANERLVLDQVVGEFIDRTLHNLLWALEESETLTIADKQGSNDKNDIVEISDGISGEPYGERGWFSLFSKNFLNREA